MLTDFQQESSWRQTSCCRCLPPARLVWPSRCCSRWSGQVCQPRPGGVVHLAAIVCHDAHTDDSARTRRQDGIRAGDGRTGQTAGGSRKLTAIVRRGCPEAWWPSRRNGLHPCPQLLGVVIPHRITCHADILSDRLSAAHRSDCVPGCSPMPRSRCCPVSRVRHVVAALASDRNIALAGGTDARAKGWELDRGRYEPEPDEGTGAREA